MNPTVPAFPSPAMPNPLNPQSGDLSPKGKLPKAAQEFEAILLNSLLQSLHDSFCSLPGDDSKAASDGYSAMGTQALASELAASGGLGIARMMITHLDHAPKTNP